MTMHDAGRLQSPRAASERETCYLPRAEGRGGGGEGGQQTPGNAAIRYCATQRPEMNNVLRDKVPRKCSFDY